VSDLHEHSAVEIGRLIRSGEVTALEVTEHFLRRIERLDCQVGAFASLDGDRALAVAASLPAGPGPLRGVPTAIKDLEAEAGRRTTAGSAATDVVPATDSTVVRLLRSAGTISLGRTTAPELGLVCYTEPHALPVARTPWDTTRSASGSSGGAAAAVAAGLVPFAQGGDGGGSIRTPASVCGLVGLKPSRGRVSGSPGADAVGLSCGGALTRTVADAAAALDVLAVPQPGDLDRPPGGDFLATCSGDPGRLRIGVVTSAPAGLPVHTACRDAVHVTARALESLDHHIQLIDCPWPEQIVDAFLDVWSLAAAAGPVPPGKEDLLRPITRHLRERGRRLDGPTALGALLRLRAMAQGFVHGTAGFDLILTPTLAAPPAPVSALRCDDDPERELQNLVAFSPFTGPANASGQPAISLPVHQAEGLPIGVQLIGRPAAEPVLLQVASQLEELLRWDLRRPPLW
jgi:amidase